MKQTISTFVVLALLISNVPLPVALSAGFQYESKIIGVKSGDGYGAGDNIPTFQAGEKLTITVTDNAPNGYALIQNIVICTFDEEPYEIIYFEKHGGLRTVTFDIVIENEGTYKLGVDKSESVPTSTGTILRNFKIVASDSSNSKPTVTPKPTATPTPTRNPVDVLANFTDVKSHWSEDAVREMVSAGLINGYPNADGTYYFSPESNITRAEFIKILYGMRDMIVYDGSSGMSGDNYIDISASDWFKPYVDWGCSKSIVTGYEDRTWRPNANITRQEIAVILTRFTSLTDIEFASQSMRQFNDAHLIADWARECVKRMQSTGIMNGDEYGNINPTSNAKRSEAATMLCKLLDSKPNPPTPTPIPTPTSGKNNNSVKTSATISAGYNSSYAIKSDNSLWTWGNIWHAPLDDGYNTDEEKAPEKMMDNVVSISASSHVMALKKDGTLWTWGRNICGQLGDGTTGNNERPTQVLNYATSIAAGGEHSMAIRTDGSVWAWGDNTYGQIGDKTAMKRTTPTKVFDDAIAIAAGSRHSFAIKLDGSLWAWGKNDAGQLGDGTTIHKYSPVKVMDDVALVSAGEAFSLAVKTDGSLWTWGDGYFGQLGNGSEEKKLSPIKIMDGVATASAGRNYSMIVKADNSLWACGYNAHAQLGDGTTSYKYTPVKIMDGVVSVHAGEMHSLAIKTDKSLWTWGDFQQFFDGRTSGCNRPAKIMDEL